MEDFLTHYQQVREDLRLQQGWGRLELARTQELILRHLPKPPGVVLDVGGAAGVYSAWLGSLGYETHLIDPVPHHVEEARKLAAHIRSGAVGDARKLAQAASSVDAVLLLGPLYHLTDRGERLAALGEAHRVLRAGGLLYAAAISRFASLLDGLVRGFVDDPRFVPILEQDLSSGQHRNPTNDPNFFTTSFFHRPEEMTAEIAEAGFTTIEVAAVEGPCWLARDFEARWADPARREQLLALVRKVEHEPALLGLSPHMLAVAKK
ncbi:MAG: class I SAM-dependent methyltransferase [Terriglobia bacterium]|jgi:SAM-dependent methyltransferase